jgi:transcriptional regulator with XRE-family HTH domain
MPALEKLSVVRQRESTSSVVARNLVIVRQVLGVTQSQLAASAQVSRATIAQIESGAGDPRLSTIADVAAALQIPAALLLLGREECAALAKLPQEAASRPLQVSRRDEQLMRIFLASGSLRDMHRAAKHGADVARTDGANGSAAVAFAAILSTVAPGSGTSIGAALGKLLEK